MEWLIIIFYVVGTVIGGCIGYGCGKACNSYVFRIREKLESLVNGLELRSKHCDFERPNELHRISGAKDVCYELMNFIDDLLDKDE